MNTDNPVKAFSALTRLSTGGGEGLFRKLIKPLTCEVWKAVSTFMH